MILNDLLRDDLDDRQLHRLAVTTIQTVRECFAGDPWFDRVAAHLQTLADRLDSALDDEQGSKLAIAMREADDARDQAFVAFRNGVKLASKNDAPGIRAAGIQLAQVIEAFGAHLYSAQDDEQTSLMNALLAKLTEAPNATAVRAAGVAQAVQEMKQANDDFKQLTQPQHDRRDNGETQPEDLRGAIGKDLSLLGAMLSFLSDTAPETAKPAIDKLNERTAGIATLAGVRPAGKQD